MRLAKYLLILLIVISFAQSACKKNESPKEKTRTELLTQKPWVLVSWRYNILGGEWKNGLGSWPVCMNDDIFTFKPDHNCVRDTGPIDCGPDFTQPLVGKWAFQGYDTYLYLNDVMLHDTYIIDALNENTMVLRAHHSTITDEITFGHP